MDWGVYLCVSVCVCVYVCVCVREREKEQKKERPNLTGVLLSDRPALREKEKEDKKTKRSFFDIFSFFSSCLSSFFLSFFLSFAFILWSVGHLACSLLFLLADCVLAVVCLVCFVCLVSSLVWWYFPLGGCTQSLLFAPYSHLTVSLQSPSSLLLVSF